MKDKHGYKRITERLDIQITYKPNGYLEEYDDYVLMTFVYISKTMTENLLLLDAPESRRLV